MDTRAGRRRRALNDSPAGDDLMYTLRNLTLVLSMLAVLLSGGEPASAKTRTVDITLALICDIYEMTENNGRGGYARIASAIKAERARSPHTFIAHAGDAISPSLMSSFDQGAHVMDLTNRLGIDLFVPGNHEFDFGPDVFRKRMAEAQMLLLAANLRDQAGAALPGIGDTTMLEFDGVKIGVIGLTAEDSVKRSSPGDLQFASSLKTVRALAPKLREQGADLVMAVAHAPRRMDFRLMNSGELDLLLSGDDHDLVLFFDGGTAMVEAKQDGEYLTAIDLQVRVTEKDGKRKLKWWPNFRIVDTANFAPDPAVAERVALYQKKLSEELDVTIGKTTTTLDSRKSAVRRAETAIGNLIADALRENHKADVALMNGGGIRGNRTYEPGTTLTRRDIRTELPFGNKAMLLEMTGAQLLKALENGLWYAGKANGRFLHVSGVTIEADSKKRGGRKILSAKVGGTPIDPASIYKVSTNSFVASGREGFDVMKEAKVILGETDGELVSNIVTRFVETRGEVSPKVEGRLIIR